MDNGSKAPDYAKLISEAERHLSDLEKSLDDQLRRAARSADRYAKLIAQGEQAIAQGQRELTRAHHREYVDCVNHYRDLLWPIAQKLDKGLDNFAARREYEALLKEGRAEAERLYALHPGRHEHDLPRSDYPAVDLRRIESALKEGPPLQRAQSVMEASRLADKDGERIYLS